MVTLSKQSICDTIMFLVVMMQAALFVLFENDIWGRYVFLLLTCIAYMIIVIEYNGIIILELNIFVIYALGFIAFTLVSSVWAINPYDALQKVITLSEIIISVYPVYHYINSRRRASLMLSALKWAGYFVALYSIFFFGYDGLMYAAETQANRLDNTLANVNVISMCVVLACVLEFWNLINRKSIWQLGFFIPCIFVLSAAQSRKAFVFLVVGIIGVIVFKNMSNKKNLNIFMSIVIAGMVFYFLLRIGSNIKSFQGIFQRMERLINSFTGNGTIDSSAEVRAEMVRIGFRTFLRYPINGVGIGCTRFVVYEAMGFNAYLHNNFVEILASGGILGFMAYYWIHFYSLGYLLFGQRQKNELEEILIIWIVLIIIMDYGLVTFYSKSQWLYFSIICASINIINKGVICNEDFEKNPKNTSLYIR